MYDRKIVKLCAAPSGLTVKVGEADPGSPVVAVALVRGWECNLGHYEKAPDGSRGRWVSRACTEHCGDERCLAEELRIVTDGGGFLDDEAGFEEGSLHWSGGEA